MHRYDALEDLVYGWVRRYAPLVSRDALDSLIDGVTDILRDSLADVAMTLPTNGLARSSVQSEALVEILQGWSGLE